MFKNKLNYTILVSIIMKLLSALGLFSISVLLAKELGVESFGLYAILLSTASIISIPLSSGLPVLLTRETARLSEHGLYELWKGLLLFSIILVVLVSMIGGVSVLLYFSSNAISRNASYLMMLIAIVPLMGLDRLRGAVMQGLGSSLLSQIPESLIRPYSYLTLIFSGIIFFNDLSLNYVFISYILSTLLSFTVGSILLSRLMVGRLNKIKPRFKVRCWFISLFSLGALSASQTLIGNADIIILGWLGSIKEVGIYKVALQGLALMVVTQTGVSAVLASKLSQGFARNDLKKIISICDVSVFIFTVMIFLSITTVYFFGNFFIKIFFGIQYYQALNILLILSLGQLINSITGPIMTLLVMSKNEGSALNSIILGGITMLSLSLFLIPIYGSKGMAVASTIGVLVTNITMAFETYKKLGFDPTILGAVRRFKN